MGKRILSFVLAFILTASDMPLSALAAEPDVLTDSAETVTLNTQERNGSIREAGIQSLESKELSASGITGDCAWSLYGTELYIGGNGKMADYSTASTLPWGTSITAVTFGPGVTYIGKFAFYKCVSLAQVVIPDNVMSVGAGAFSGCKGMSSVQLSHSVKTIEAQTFYGCSALTAFSVPEGVTCINNQAFGYCSNLTEVTLPNSISEIDHNAFLQCGKLAYNTYDTGCYLGTADNPYFYLFKPSTQYIKSLVVHESTRIIGRRAFSSCAALTSVTIGEQVTHIRDNAFYNCEALSSVTMGERVLWIDEGAFSYCGKLTNVSLSDGIVYIAGDAFAGCPLLSTLQESNGNYLGSKSNPHMVLVKAKSSTSFVFYDDTRVILDEAFKDCTKLTDITIPDSVLAIGQGVFAGCSALTSLTVPFVGQRKIIDTADSLQTDKNGNILASLFGTEQSSDFYSVTFSYNSTSYGPYYVPRALQSISVTGGEIFRGAFYGCTTVTSIDFPQNITYIGEQAFAFCKKMTDIAIPGSVTVIGESAFKNCIALTEVVVPDTVLSVKKGAFNGCTALQSITIPFVGESRNPDSKNYEHFFGYIFGTESFTGSTSQSFPTSLYGSSYYYLPSTLATVIVTGGHIENQAFINCTGISTVTLCEGITTIGQEAFKNCSKLKNITLPNSLSQIGDDAFSGVSPTTTIDGTGKYIGNTENPYLALVGVTSTTITTFEFREETKFILDKAFINCSKLTSMQIPEHIIQIGAKAFYKCSGLTSVELPEHTTRIGTQTFYGCSKLASIRIPKSVSFIGSGAFSNCTSLAVVDTPDLAAWSSITFESGEANPANISKKLYVNGVLLTELVIPSSVTQIGSYAFYKLTGITSVTMPSSVTSIGDHAFDNCTSLKTVVFSDKLKSIGSYAFQACTSLTELVIPSSVETIGQYALSKCAGLRSITIPFIGAGKPASSSSPRYPLGYLFGIGSYTGGTSTSQTYYSSGTGTATTSSTYYIPSSLTSVTVTGGDIPYGAFQRCKQLTEIKLPETATQVGGCAFQHCTGLAEIAIPSNITAIGESAFYGCTLLKGISIPSNVTSIGESAFYGCTLLKSISIPSQVSAIGSSAFQGCTALEKVAILGSVATVGTNAFQKCTALTEVNGKIQDVGNYAFSYCAALVKVPSGLRNIGNYAFKDCSSLSEIVISEDATTVGKYAFENCSALAKVNFPGSMQTIGDYAFTGCVALNDFTMASGIVSIGTYAFRGCAKLAKVVVPDSVQEIGLGAFSGCAALESVTVPFVGQSKKAESDTNQYPFGYIFGTESYDGSIECAQTYCTTSSSTTVETTYYIPKTLVSATVTGGSILRGAFQNCSGLQEIILPDGITSLEAYAFNGCRSLKRISIPKGVTAIKANAFDLCTSLSEVIIPSGVLSIDNYAFYKCISLSAISIPDGVTSIGSRAFMECTSLKEITIPDSVQRIGSAVFACCISLESITVPFIGKTRTPTDDFQYPLGYFFLDAVCFDHGYPNTTQTYYVAGTSTKESTQYYIPYSLKKVTVTDGNLYYGAFDNCTSLTTIALGEGVLSINQSSFSGCSNLEQFEVDANNPNYSSVNRILYNKSQTSIICKPAKHSYQLQVSYTYINGDTALTTDIHKIGAGEAYNFEIPQIPGYSTRIDSISGTMPADDVSIDVVYYENDIQIYGECNDSITWTLYEDGVLVLRGTGNIPDYESGGAPWAAYADQVLMVYIDSRITGIGNRAFENCRNMTFIDYGYSIKTIGKYAFSGCTSLVSFKLPDSVTTISKGSFSGCTGLTSAVIPDGIISVDEDAFRGCSALIQVTIGGAISDIGSNAFADCGNLTQLYFRGKPAELGGNALGTTGGKFVYYYSSVSGWNEVISDGKWHGYTAVPYNAIARENFTGTNVYIIKVVDKHGTPLVNAVVTLGDTVQSTNDDGMAYFPKPEEAQKLTVSCSNHITFEDTSFSATTSQIMDIIELSDKPSTLQGVRLNSQSIATSVAVLNCAESTDVTITVSGYSKYTITRYELYQGDRLIATSKTSTTSCTFRVAANAFEEGQTVLVRMHTADGNYVAAALNIDVIKLANINPNQIMSELSNVNIEANLGDFGDLNFEIPFAVKGIGGLKDNLYVYTEGRSIFVGINIDVKELFSRKMSRKAIQQKVDYFMASNGLDSHAERGVDVNLGGYIEIVYLGEHDYYIKSSYVKLGVTLMLESEIHASFYGIAGVYFKVRLGAGGELELYFSGFEPEAGFMLDELDLTLKTMLELEGGAFLLYGAGSAGVFGNLTMGFTIGFIPQPTEIKSVFITGDLGVRWKLAWGVLSGEISIGPKDIYRWPEAASVMSLRLYEASQDPNSYSAHDRSYLANRSDWLSGKQEDGTLQSNIYESVAPKIVVYGDTAVMVWLDDNSQRDDANFQTLYYSVYSNGVWSEPVAICDNETFDCEFDVCTDGERIYVIYTEMASKLSAVQTLDITDTASIEAFVSSVEVNVAVYENGKFGTPVRLTENSVCEQLPSIAAVDGVITATWLESNSLGVGADATSDNRIIRAVLDGEVWRSPDILMSGQNPVSDITPVSLSGNAYNAYIADADGDNSTTNDKVLVLRFEDGNSVQLDKGAIANVAFTNIAGTPALTWYNDGNIYMITDADQKPTALMPENVAAGIDYQIVSVSDEQSLLFFTARSCSQDSSTDNGSDIYGLYINCNGAVSSPVQITMTEGYVTSYCIYPHGEDLFAVFTETFAEVSGGGLDTVTHLRTAELEFGWNIAVENMTCDISTVQPNSEFNIEFSVTNTGMNSTDSLVLNLYDHSGNLIYTTECNTSLNSGASAQCKATVFLPQNISAESYIVEILPKSKMAIVKDSEPANNRVELMLAYADMSICAEQKIIGEKNYIIFSVTNDGNVGAAATLQVHTRDKLLSELKTDSIAPGITQQYLVDIHALTSSADKVLTCTVVSDFTDPYTLNNTDSVYLLHIDDQMLSISPDEAIRNPELSTGISEYDKHSAQDISVQISKEADCFAGIEGLIPDKDYSISQSTVTISSTYLATLSPGTHTLNFMFDFGDNSSTKRSLVVIVSDTAPVALAGSISISGDVVVGSTVFADTAKLTPNTASVLYAWSIDGETVSTNSSYTIKAQDNGKTLKLTIVAADGFTGTFTAESIVTLRKPDAPSAPMVSKIDSDSIILVRAEGLEYSLDGTVWQSSNEFNNLLPNKTYTVYTRWAATDTSKVSDISAGVTLTTKKQTVASPESPKLQSKDCITIILVPDESMEYRIEGGKWTEDNVFTGLQPDTAYVFYQRYKETSTAFASEPSMASFTTEGPLTIRGTIVSFGQSDGEIVIKLMQDGKDITSAVTTTGTYELTAAVPEGSYQLLISKKDHATRTYEIVWSGDDLTQDAKIHLLGDINGDGRLRSNDLSLVFYHIIGTEKLTDDYILQCADIDGNGKIQTDDIFKIYGHVSGNEYLW